MAGSGGCGGCAQWPGGPMAACGRDTCPSCSRLSRAAFMPASRGRLPLCAFLDSAPGSAAVTHSRWLHVPGCRHRGPAHRRCRVLWAYDSHPPPSASPVISGRRLFLSVPQFPYLYDEGPLQCCHRQQVSQRAETPTSVAAALQEVLAIVRDRLASRTLSSLCLIFHTSFQIILFLEEYEGLGKLP